MSEKKFGDPRNMTVADFIIQHVVAYGAAEVDYGIFVTINGHRVRAAVTVDLTGMDEAVVVGIH